MVVLASAGYPQKYATVYEITLPACSTPKSLSPVPDSGTKSLSPSGGRVLGVHATTKTLREAGGRAYAAADKIAFETHTAAKTSGRELRRRWRADMYIEFVEKSGDWMRSPNP